MRITKVYTRQGDTGNTRLVGGQKVPKDSVRIEAYGTVDELNAIVGLVRMELDRATPTSGAPEGWDVARAQLDTWLEGISNDLFNLGSDLATQIEDRWESMWLIEGADSTRLEGEIDRMNGTLAPLEEFILPGGGPASAVLHQARTVCRRAERVTVEAGRSQEINPEAIRYLNRLSDWFFVAGRWIAAAGGEREQLWDRSR